MPFKLIFILALTLLSGLISNTAFAQLKVFACEPEWAALARELGGDKLDIFTATTAKQDPHHIQARPSLIAKARRADLLVCNGAELEVGWLPVLLRKSGNGKILPGQPGHFMATDYVQLLEKPEKLDRSMGDVHAAGNPHIHLDPHRIVNVAKALEKTLSTLDSEHQTKYQQNLADFLSIWKTGIKQWEQVTGELRGESVIVHHDNWIYLEQWIGLQKVATLEPKPGIPPSSGHLAKILNSMRQSPADKILYADYRNDRAARWLADKTAIPVFALPFSPSENESLKTWFDRLIEKLTQ